MDRFSLSLGLIAVAALPALAADGPRNLPQLSVTDACKAVDAAIAAVPRAKESVAVVDADGSLVCFKHADGAIHAGVPGSIGKAVASAYFGVSSKTLEVRMGAGAWISGAPGAGNPATVPVPTLPGVAATSLPAPIYSQGARPIIRGGVVDGAVGCGGGTPEEDDACAAAGAGALAEGRNS